MKKEETISFNFTSDEIFNILLQHLRETKEIDDGYDQAFYSFSHEFEIDEDEIMFSVKTIRRQ
jgi:hypothetical protein